MVRQPVRISGASSNTKDILWRAISSTKQKAMKSRIRCCIESRLSCSHLTSRHNSRASTSFLVKLLFLGSCCLISTSRSFQILLVQAGETTIPRSTNRYSNYPTDIDTTTSHESSSERTHHPPWNPSTQIDPSGYLTQMYHRSPGTWEQSANLRGRYGPRSKSYETLTNIPVRIRQVPGDGNCLFHSIAVVLSKVENGTDLVMDSPRGIHELRQSSMNLRNRAVDALQSAPRRRLFLQGDEYLEARELLMAAASQFDLEGNEYCDLMRRESYWGGGPEIVALCNCLQRPIHIYELIPSTKSASEIAANSQLTDNQHPTSTQFTLRRMACFGSPKFDRREPLHILSADSRFPDVEPRKIRKVGNHFLALFPVEDERKNMWSRNREIRLRRHALIRGGTNDRVKHSEVKTKNIERNHVDDESTAKNNRWDGGTGRWSI